MSAGGARRAVLIGNGVFPRADGSLTPLAAPAHDVGVLAGILSDADLCRFEAPQRLVDADATTVKKALLRTLETAGPADLVVIYYAGHGKLDGAQLYLCANDTEPEALAATSISIRDIHHFVGRSACRQVVLILDCCFSGAAADEFQTRGEMVDRITAAAAPARGLYLLTSCGAYETALERGAGDEGDVPYGLYTRALVDGIVSGEADVYRDGRITPLELARYLQERIPGQTPRVTLIDAEGEEPVLAWTGWSLDDEKRGEVRERLAGWFADEVIPYDVMHEAMQLLTRVPRNRVEKRRRRLLALCTGAGWGAVFARAWRSLGDGAAPGDFERFLTEHAAEDELPERMYVEAMRLLAAEPANDVQRRLKLLLASFAREEHRDVRILLDAWRALERRRTPEPPPQPAPDPAPPPPPEASAPPEEERPAAPTDDIALPGQAAEPESGPSDEDHVLRVETPPVVAPPPGLVLAGDSQGAEVTFQMSAGLRSPREERVARAVPPPPERERTALPGFVPGGVTRPPEPPRIAERPTPSPPAKIGAEERYARAELRFLKAVGIGGGIILASAILIDIAERTNKPGYYAADVVEDTSVIATAAPVDTTMGWDTMIAAVTSPIVDVSRFTPGLVSRVRELGYVPIEMFLDGSESHADAVVADEPNGLYHGRRAGRIFIRQRAAGQSANVGWDFPQGDFVARASIRFEDGDPGVGAGWHFRDGATVLLSPGVKEHTTQYWESGRWQIRQPWTYTPAIDGNRENVLEIGAAGPHVLVYINGVHVSTLSGFPLRQGSRLNLRVGNTGATYSFGDIAVVALSQDVTATP